MLRVGQALLLFGLIFVASEPGIRAQDKDTAGDTIVPIASGISEYKTQLDIDGQSTTVVIPYAQQAKTVFLLPVWQVRSVRRLVPGSPPLVLKPSDLVSPRDLKSELRLEFDVINVLDNEIMEKAVQAKLKERIAQRSGLSLDKLELSFAVPQIRPQSYRFTLIGPGRGDETLPAEVPLSAEFRRLPDGKVRLTVDSSTLALVEVENGSPLTLAQAFLRCTGEMRVRTEQMQVIAQTDYVRGAVTALRKRLSSIKDSQGRSPEVFVELPSGGTVDSENTLRSLVDQSLQVTISARAGADTAPILSLVRTELNSILDRCKTTVNDENKRVAFLLDKQIAISGTLGEIHKLAKGTEKERAETFRAMTEGYRKRVEGKSSDYSGAVSVGTFYGSVPVSGRVVWTQTETREERQKREEETLRKGFDYLMKEFNGKLPTLSGIAFDDKSLTSSFERATKTFEERKFTTGDVLHRWPLISLSGRYDGKLTPDEVLRAYVVLKADHEALLKTMGMPAKLAEARAAMERVVTLTAELERKQTLLDKALAQVDKAALARLEREVARLDRRSSVLLGRPLKGHLGMVTSVAFSPDGKLLLTGSSDRTARLWEATTGKEIGVFRGHTGTIHSVAFSPDGKQLLTGSEDATAKLWNIETGKEVRTLKGHANGVWCVAFAADGKSLLTGSEDKTAKLWNAATGEEIRTIEGHTGAVTGVAFSPDGKQMLTGSDDHTAVSWNTADGEKIKTFESHTSSIWAVSFSPDGKQVLTASRDNTAKLWDAETGEVAHTLKGHSNSVWSIAFSPDGKHLLTGSRDSSARIWSVATGEEIRTLQGHTNPVLSVAFSPDGKWFATASMDRTARVWELED